MSSHSTPVRYSLVLRYFHHFIVNLLDHLEAARIASKKQPVLRIYITPFMTARMSVREAPPRIKPGSIESK